MSGRVDNLEVEVKFFVPDLEGIRTRLREKGAYQMRPRLFERNVLFDSEDEKLRAAGKLLRLRQDDRARLTFKGAAAESQPSEVKVREELEVEVSDFDTAAQLLERIGFRRGPTYEKYRETFSLGDVEVVLDELPFGNFVELEGEEEAIRVVADQLNLPWPDRIIDNYMHLMGRLKSYYELPFEDLTFSRFEGIDVSIADVL